MKGYCNSRVSSVVSETWVFRPFNRVYVYSYEPELMPCYVTQRLMYGQHRACCTFTLPSLYPSRSPVCNYARKQGMLNEKEFSNLPSTSPWRINLKLIISYGPGNQRIIAKHYHCLNCTASSFCKICLV